MTDFRKLALVSAWLISLLFAPEAMAGSGRDYCREYTARVSIGSDGRSGYGTACLRPDGSWEIVRTRDAARDFDDRDMYPYDLTERVRIRHDYEDRGWRPRETEPTYIIIRETRHEHFVPPGHRKHWCKKKHRDRDRHDHRWRDRREDDDDDHDDRDWRW